MRRLVGRERERNTKAGTDTDGWRWAVSVDRCREKHEDSEGRRWRKRSGVTEGGLALQHL